MMVKITRKEVHMKIKCTVSGQPKKEELVKAVEEFIKEIRKNGKSVQV